MDIPEAGIDPEVKTPIGNAFIHQPSGLASGILV
jgi:hypothetical protein